MFAELKAIFCGVMSDRKGVTALEYGVIAAATVVAGMAAFGAIGDRLVIIFGGAKTALGG